MNGHALAVTVCAAWLALAVFARRRPPLAVLAAVNALAWLAPGLLPGALTWHRGAVVHLLLAGGAWSPRSWVARAVVVCGWVAAVLVRPWVWPWTASCLTLALVVAARLERRRHQISPVRHATWRLATVLAATTLVVPPLLGAVGLPRTWAQGVLNGYALASVLVVVLLVLAVRPWARPWPTDLAVELDGRPPEQLERALATAESDPWQVGEQARLALARAEELRRRLAERREQLAATLAQTERSRLRLVAVDRQERRALRSSLEEVAVARLERVLARLGARAPDGGTPQGAAAGRALQHLRLAVVELDGLGEGLAPADLADGLGPAMERLAARTPLPVHLELPASQHLARVPQDVAECVYYVATESLANVVKHAAARSVLLRLHVGEEVELVVVDDGVGLPAGSRDGLPGLRERAEEVGGQVVVASTPGRGTRVRVAVPSRPGVPAWGP